MKITEGGKLERPNVCFLCETTPAVGSRVVDTERYFDGFPINLQGRRYVCERCVTEMFKFFSFASWDDVRLARQGENEAQFILKGLKIRLDELHRDLKNLAENPNVFIEIGREAVESESEDPEGGTSPEGSADRPVADEFEGFAGRYTGA